jgi:hypothetical protein
MCEASLIENVYEFVSKGATFLANNREAIARGVSMLSSFV